MSTIDIKLPDIGNLKDVPVIEIHVDVGDVIEKDAPLVTLESDKATMEVPSPHAGTVRAMKIKVGDKLNEGQVLLTLDVADGDSKKQTTKKQETKEQRANAPVAREAVETKMPALASTARAETAKAAKSEAAITQASLSVAHASPSVRKFAREIGVDLSRVEGSGPKERITKEDVKAFAKKTLEGGTAVGAAISGLLPWPVIDFAQFGATESVPLSRIKKISGANLARNWVMIPHVTQFDSADITALEALRVALNKENEESGVKITMLAFLMKACAAALKRFPDFNASLQGENLILKKYYHLGFAADTPNGLVVPVIRDCDQKTVSEIAAETAELASKARAGKLMPGEMQGGVFTISSLGGIGGTAFTPIINAPEVAILGVSKSAKQPVWDGSAFVPRLMLPLSLSYDHRVIDGAQGARFITYLARLLADMRQVLV
ncbi:MAG: dihydrolipoyllysine-residue acetyltransferase [Burkholderiales bacterium]|jgi:pyruvate dehydrogenase E2 component (dihydrolipoamide acetyltransferase)|nr:dihydrolipoyllysine-residue acetyltransferase [Burkholderiales bacterium]